MEEAKEDFTMLEAVDNLNDLGSYLRGVAETLSLVSYGLEELTGDGGITLSLAVLSDAIQEGAKKAHRLSEQIKEIA